MILTFPTNFGVILEKFDIPENFTDERVQSDFFQRFINDPGTDTNSVQNCFYLSHITNKWNLEANYLCKAFESEIYKNADIKNSIFNALFVILYSNWDYSFQDPNLGIESGISRFQKYFDEDFYKDFSNDQKFVQLWVKENLDSEKIIKMLNLRKLPFSDDFNGISDSDRKVIEMLRDAQVYGPLYSIQLYPNELIRPMVYELILATIIEYGVKDPEEFEALIKSYYESPVRHQPTEFTKGLIEKYNSQNGTGFLKGNIAGITQDIFREENFSEVKNSLMKENPSTFNENSLIF